MFSSPPGKLSSPLWFPDHTLAYCEKKKERMEAVPRWYIGWTAYETMQSAPGGKHFKTISPYGVGQKQAIFVLIAMCSSKSFWLFSVVTLQDHESQCDFFHVKLTEQSGSRTALMQFQSVVFKNLIYSDLGLACSTMGWWHFLAWSWSSLDNTVLMRFYGFRLSHQPVRFCDGNNLRKWLIRKTTRWSISGQLCSDISWLTDFVFNSSLSIKFEFRKLEPTRMTQSWISNAAFCVLKGCCKHVPAKGGSLSLGQSLRRWSIASKQVPTGERGMYFKGRGPPPQTITQPSSRQAISHVLMTVNSLGKWVSLTPGPCVTNECATVATPPIRPLPSSRVVHNNGWLTSLCWVIAYFVVWCLCCGGMLSSGQ